VDEQVQEDEVDAQCQQADGEEPRRLEAGVALGGLEGPVPVEQAGFGDGDAEREHGGGYVMDPASLRQHGEDDEVDDIPAPTDDAELEQLYTVIGLPDAEMAPVQN